MRLSTYKKESIMNKIQLKLTIFVLVSLILIVSCGNNKPSDKINAMTHNIRTWSNYKECTPQRIDNLMSERKIDILGTQELHIQQINDIDSLLENYNWFGVARDDGKEDGEFCAIFYNNKTLELKENDTFWLSETPSEAGSRSWNTACTRIVTWGKFKVKSSGNIFYHFNTHFDHRSDLAREESAKLLRRMIIEKVNQKPVVITGDFNFTPDSDPYNIVTAKDDKLSLFDSKKITLQQPLGSEGTSNSFEELNPTRRIDYIFVNDLTEVKTYEVINEKYKDEFISDHFPVHAKIELK